MTKQRLASRLLVGLAVWAAAAYAVVASIVVPHEKDPDKRAIVLMGGALMAIWCLLGGLLMRWQRDRLVRWARRIPLGWRTRFVLLCIALGLLEEAVTTGLTNAAGLFGGATDAARITASKNYLEVVLLHSVIVFVPMFICWALLLSRYAFAPGEVMLLFGLTGWLAELVTFGPQNVGLIGMWVYVYGLMVYLPACTAPADRRARAVRWWHWPLAVVAPFVFAVPFVPVVLLVRKACACFGLAAS
jgi:hypothetical protein